MARPAPILRAAKQASARVASIPAPIGGWNARDSLANMKPTDAVSLTNYFPTATNVVLRGGYQKHATGFPGQVETLMPYNGATSQKLFAISNGGIYEATTAGAIGAAAVSGLTNSRWESTNVATAGGNYLYAVSGGNSPLLYDGATWTAITGASTPAITGVTTSELDNICLFKNRVWFIQRNTLKAWYLPTQSVGGAAQVLDLSTVARKGGYLLAMGVWTIDAGFGLDDNLVFVTTQGEIIIYRGTDPANASTWSLVGVWAMGSPMGKRCLQKFAGDLAYIAFDGLFPLSQALQSARVAPESVALTNKIQGAFAAATTSYSASFGWEICVAPKFNAILVNIPAGVGSQQQYVMNTIVQSWCNFTGWPANTFCLHKQDLYFGGTDYVAKAWTDDHADDGSAISAGALQAFNYFGSRGQKKIFTRARPNLFADGQPAVFVGMNVDFQVNDTSAPLAYLPSTAAVWDTAVWDLSTWGAGQNISLNWQGVTGVGYCGSVNFRSASKGLSLEWAATDVVFMPGWVGI